MIKKLLITSSILAALLLGVSTVSAQGIGSRLTNRLTAQASASAQRQSTELSKLQQRADNAISKRLTDLNRLISRIQNDKRLTADDKATLSTNVQNSINGLTQLKAKIDADTDLVVAQSDAKEIVTGFRVYLVVNPQTQLLIMIDNLTTTSSNIQKLTPQLQNLINTLKSQGKDTTALQQSLDDINSQLQTINTQLSADKTTVSGVTISTQNPQATFTSVRKDLAGVRADFAKIRSDFAQMRDSFKISIKGGNSGRASTPSASIKSSTPSATPQ